MYTITYNGKFTNIIPHNIHHDYRIKKYIDTQLISIQNESLDEKESLGETVEILWCLSFDFFSSIIIRFSHHT